mgnify:FL=1
MPLPVSRSALDALGRRLRQGEVTDADWLLLHAVLDSYQRALDEVQATLAALGYASTSRVKSTGTLIDKLNRGTSFKSVQDVAGVRIVIDGGCSEQDEVVDAIVREFGASSRVVDRRANPTHGYRAVHVIVRRDELPVEIQVRTTPQDSWAQTIERLADRGGRGIRYGEPLVGADIEIVPGYTRGHLLETLDRATEVIARFEDMQRERSLDQVAFTEFEESTNDLLAAISDLYGGIDDALG